MCEIIQKQFPATDFQTSLNLSPEIIHGSSKSHSGVYLHRHKDQLLSCKVSFIKKIIQVEDFNIALYTG